MYKHMVIGGLIAIAISTCAAAATTVVLLEAGDAANDGVRLAGFEDPVAADAGAVVFRGTTAALMSRTGDTLAVLLRTGDPLPAPLAGTFGGFAHPVVNDAGAIAFRAAGAGADPVDGVFLYEAGTTTAVESHPNGELRGFDLSASGHVAFGDDAGLWLWTGPASAPTPIVPRGQVAPGGGTFETVADPVLNAADTVVFHATVSDGRTGLFVWRPGTDVSLVAEGSFPGVAINASGQIAFADTQRVQRFDPSDSSITVLAAARSTIGSVAVRRIFPEFVGIDSAGNVAFEATLRTAGRRLVRAAGGTLTTFGGTIPNAAREFAPRLTDAGHVVWRRARSIFLYDGTTRRLLSPVDATPFGRDVGAAAPSLNASDVVAFVATRGALYRLGGGAPERIAQADDTLPTGEAITHVGSYAAAGRAVAILASTAPDRWVALLADANGLHQLAATGDPVPLRGRLALDETASIDIRGRTVLFTTAITSARGDRSGLFTATPGARPHLVVAAGNGGFRYRSIAGVEALGRDILFSANPRHGGAGLFLGSAIGTTSIVRVGQPAPGTDRRFDAGSNDVGATDAFAARRGRVLFVAHLDDDAQTPGLFLWRNGRRDKLLLAGEPLPGGGTAAAFLAIAVGDGAEAFVARDADNPPAEGLYLSRNGALTRLIGTGDPTLLGGRIASLDAGGSIAFRGDAVVYGATLGGASAPAALFATTP
jgi:hypothetical protein